MIDGLSLAQDLRQEEPEHFSALTEILVDSWQYYDCQAYLMWNQKPIIQLNSENEIAGIYSSHKNMNVRLPFDQVERFYAAFSVFISYVKNPKYQHIFKLKAGNCFLFNNSRMLHGRKSFDPSEGFRHLETSYVEWDYLKSILNLDFLQQPSIEGLSMLKV